MSENAAGGYAQDSTDRNGYPPFVTPHHTRVVRRVARTPKRCSETWLFAGHPIKPGEVYLEWTEFPGGEAGYADSAGHPVRMAECADCATRYGRADLLRPPLLPTLAAGDGPQGIHLSLGGVSDVDAEQADWESDS